MPRIILAFIFLFFVVATTEAQEFIPLWPAGKMPDSKGLQMKDSIVNERVYCVAIPGIYVFSPSAEDNGGAAIVIFPGGGYSHITLNLSGFQLAKWFNTLGMTAFVVEYRLPNSPDLMQRELAPMQDGQRALQLIRSQAARWRVKRDKIGLLGVSAGGHLASWIGTSTEDITAAGDSIQKNSFRPDFMILISAVIDMGKYVNSESLENLLGKNPSEESIKRYSTQNRVTSQTPPCLIFDAIDDKAVLPENSLLFYQALLNNKITAGFHVFPQGGTCH